MSKFEINEATPSGQLKNMLYEIDSTAEAIDDCAEMVLSDIPELGVTGRVASLDEMNYYFSRMMSAWNSLMDAKEEVKGVYAQLKRDLGEYEASRNDLDE